MHRHCTGLDWCHNVIIDNQSRSLAGVVLSRIPSAGGLPVLQNTYFHLVLFLFLKYFV